MTQTIPTPYEDLLRRIMDEGSDGGDRTGTGTRSLFGEQIKYDLSQGFPLVTTKRVFLRGVIEELLWLLRGDSNITYLRERNVKIWDAWADEAGDIGRMYPTQWRRWLDKDGREHDQIANAIELIRTDPTSRRIIVSAWNPGELDQMALAPCHAFFQFYVRDGRLSCKLTQRSADMFLGVAFNIASYALLTMMIAQQTGLEPGDLIWSGGDCHIYSNHFEQVEEQLSREARPYPTMRIRKAADIDSYTYEDFEIVGYDPHPTIKAPVAV